MHMPFGAFHWYDLLILVVLALLIFGPKRLPEMGSAIGKTIKEFQKSMREVTGGDHSAQAAPPAIPPVTATATPELSAPAATPTVSAAAEAPQAPAEGVKLPEGTTP
jgi:sec-independent protein translocase protein TatA